MKANNMKTVMAGMINRTVLTSVMAVALTTLAPYSARADALGDPAARSAGANGSGGLAAVEAEVKAGEITVGSTNQVVVKFRNDTGKEVKIGAINLYPSSTVGAEVALNECTNDKAALATGAECAVVVSVKGLKTGNWRVEALLRHDGKSRIVTASLTGSVVAGDDKTNTLASDVETIPSELDFGSMQSSRPLVKSVILRNVTSIPITIKKVSVEASAQAGYSFTTDCSKLDVGQACVAAVTWAPMSQGKSAGVLIVDHDGPARVASVNMKGSFEPKAAKKAEIFPDAVPGAGLLVSSSEKIDFGTITNEASMTVSLVNVGDQDMIVKDISLGSADKGLTVAASGCRTQTVLKPVEACALTLNWSPVRAGELVEDVRISHDGVRGVLVIPVRGKADTAVNRDSKAVVVTERGMDTQAIKPVEKKQALEGFVITSHSRAKAIINGPGGSRVISDGQDVVLGGVEWKASIIDAGIEFLSGKDRVRLLFDKSLSAGSKSGGTTSSGSSGSSGSTASSSGGSSGGSASSSSSSSGSTSTATP